MGNAPLKYDLAYQVVDGDQCSMITVSFTGSEAEVIDLRIRMYASVSGWPDVRIGQAWVSTQGLGWIRGDFRIYLDVVTNDQLVLFKLQWGTNQDG